MREILGSTTKICRFKGKDESCGFTKGKSYLLEIADVRSDVLSEGKYYGFEYTVMIKSRGRGCTYSNMDKFLENWEIIG